jgi:hypothetical protein
MRALTNLFTFAVLSAIGLFPAEVIQIEQRLLSKARVNKLRAPSACRSSN